MGMWLICKCKAQSKGQEISEYFSLVFNFSKKPENYPSISALAPKKWLSNGILLPKLFFSKIFRSVEQFIQTVEGQNNFW